MLKGKNAFRKGYESTLKIKNLLKHLKTVTSPELESSKKENMATGELKVIMYPDSRLIQVSTSCEQNELPQIMEWYKEMATCLYSYGPVALGLAAIQVGIPKRFCLIGSGKVGEEHDDRTKPNLLINPEVTSSSDDVDNSKEGCLSLPYFYEKIERPVEVTVDYLDENWEKKTAIFNEMQARCILHEIDHMDGILQHDQVSLMKRQMWKKKLKKKGLL